ncbi:unnamed protein product [Rotaria socialis]|uniref:Rootletin-like coiled-coil domain-containing protein n=2 Tax=Rotaria socialis TaxID=392032 RepID=A0A817YD82_9BILA|nr:unnamed protein product [Rotaria socialis]CAF3376943.1 unnamed protein product [Rotaria socialis]
MVDDILERSIHLDETLAHDDDYDDNRSTPIRGQIQDVFLNRPLTPAFTRSRSPFTVSSQGSSRNLMTTPTSGQLIDENRYLNDELNRVETVLNLTRAEKDELSIRYNALSDRLEQSLRAQGVDLSSDMSTGEPERRILVQQNIELRRKLEEEHQNYKRKLSNYQEGQLKQAQLVQKLQQKVLQYKNRCTELELLIEQHKKDMDRIRLSATNTTALSFLTDTRTTQNIDEQSAVSVSLDEEKQKSANFAQLNKMLRDQLDQAHLTNQQLTDDLRRNTNELQKLREEFTQKTRDWQQEERILNQFYNKEHNLMYELWRDVVSFRKEFTELKGTTERDLNRVRADLTQTGRSLTSACFGFLTTSKTAESQGQFAIERERHDRTSLENQIREKTRELADLQQRLQELSQTNEKLRFQLAEKDGTITTLTRATQIQSQAVETSSSALETRTREISADTERLHQRLRDLAQIVLNDEDDTFDGNDLGRTSPRRLSPLRGAERFDSPDRGYTRLRSPRSNSPQRPIQASRPHSRNVSPSFVDSTFSAVHAALNKRQVQTALRWKPNNYLNEGGGVHDLQTKLSTARETIQQLKDQYNQSEAERRHLDQQAASYKLQIEELRRQFDDTATERDRSKSALANSNNERTNMEKLRITLNAQIDALRGDCDRLQQSNTELQRQRDLLDEEKDDLQKDKIRQVKENERCMKVIENLENKISQLKTDVTELREQYHKEKLTKDVLSQEKHVLSDALSRSESYRAEIEVDLSKERSESATLRDLLCKIQALNEGLAQDKIELNKIILMVEQEKNSIHNEKSDVEQDKSTLRQELVRVEQDKIDVENERDTILHRLQLTDVTRQQIEQELNMVNREKVEIIEQFQQMTRLKNTLAEDLVAAKKDIERLSEHNARLNKEKEELTKERGNLVVDLTGTERDNQTLNSTIGALRAEKEALETNLYEAQNIIGQLEVKKGQLEGENQELLLRKEQLQGEIQRLHAELNVEVEKSARQRDQLHQRLTQVERDKELIIQQHHQAHEDDIERMTRERDKLRHELETAREESIRQLTRDKDESVQRYEKEKEDLHYEIANVITERDQSLMEAENEKQKLLSMAQTERNALAEKLSLTKDDLMRLQVEFDKIRREAALHHEQDRQVILSLQDELKKFHIKFEDVTLANDRDVKVLQEDIDQLRQQRQLQQHENAEIKTQLKLNEENRDQLKRDLIESNRRIREYEENMTIQRKEIQDLKRYLQDEQRDKDLSLRSCDDLRTKLKSVENEKIDLRQLLDEAKQRIIVLEEQKSQCQKDANDLRHNLRDVERSRLEARRELQELRRHVKMLDGETKKKSKEVEELADRVRLDEQREEEMRREVFGQKQKFVEAEASREVLRKELANIQRHYAELEDEQRMKERDFRLAIEDARRIERKAIEERRNVELALENANQMMSELRIVLSGAEGRASALDTQLARVEGAKRDAEYKLGSIVSSLRRTIGYGSRSRSGAGIRSRSPSPTVRRRPISPTKGFDSHENRASPILRRTSRSPHHRSRSPGYDVERAQSPGSTYVDVADIDPEQIRSALRDFVQSFISTERDRDDCVSETTQLRRINKELEDNLARSEFRFNQLQKTLMSFEEDKKGVDTRLQSAQSALLLHEDTIRRSERERKTMIDQITALERQILGMETEKKQIFEKMNFSKSSEARLSDEKRQLKRALEEYEARTTDLEMNKRALEGEIQRLNMILTDKDTEIQVHQERCDTLIKQIQDREEKCQSLQLSVDRLSLTLAKIEEGESSLKTRVHSLNQTLSQTNYQAADLQQKLGGIQNALQGSEADRRILQDKLEQSRSQVCELKKQNHELLERVHHLQNEITDSDMRRHELENQLRNTNTLLVQRQESEQEAIQKISILAADKQAVQEKNALLQRQLGNLDLEKREAERSKLRLEKDKNVLKKTLDKVERERVVTEDIVRSWDRAEFDRQYRRIEEENLALQKQVEHLQAALNESEQQHAQRLIDLATRSRRETEAETERIRSSQTAAERALEAREKSHRTRVKGLEEQITTLKEQLHQELRKRQSFLTRSMANGDEINALRREITDSLTFVSQDPRGLDPVHLDHETKRLADMNEQPVRHRSPNRRNLSPPIALRSMRAAASIAAASPSHLGPQSPNGRARSSRPRY